MTDALVSTEWVILRLHEGGVKAIEVSSTGLEDYARGHIEGAENQGPPGGWIAPASPLLVNEAAAS